MRQSLCQGDNTDEDDDYVCDDEDAEVNKDMKETRQMENIEELLDFFLVANDETRRNVTGLMKVHTSSLFILKSFWQYMKHFIRLYAA